MTAGIKMAIVQLNSCFSTKKSRSCYFAYIYCSKNSTFLVKDIQKINIFSEIESFYSKTMPKYLTKKLCLT